MTVHTLKCWPQYYDAMQSGEKPFELRLNDRDFQKGDTLLLARTKESALDEIDYEIDPVPGTEPPEFRPKHVLMRHVTYILHGPKFGLASGYCIMGLRE